MRSVFAVFIRRKVCVRFIPCECVILKERGKKPKRSRKEWNGEGSLTTSLQNHAQ